MMITEGKKKKKKGGKEKTGMCQQGSSPPCETRVGRTWSTVLGTGHLITAGKLEDLGTAASAMKGLLGLTWGERLKD